MMEEDKEMTDDFPEWLNELSRKNIILDLGGGAPFQGQLKSEKIQEGSKYYCMDFCADFKPHILGDIQMLPFKDKSVDGIYCEAVLEHVPEPWVAIKEMYRILRSGGLLLVYVPFMFPYHGGKEFRDYYRFSNDAIQHMFKEFSQIKVSSAGGYINATLRFMTGFMTFQRYLLRWEKWISAFFNNFFDEAKKEYPNRFEGLAKSTTGYGVYAIK